MARVKLTPLSVRVCSWAKPPPQPPLGTASLVRSFAADGDKHNLVLYVRFRFKARLGVFEYSAHCRNKALPRRRDIDVFGHGYISLVSEEQQINIARRAEAACSI